MANKEWGEGSFEYEKWMSATQWLPENSAYFTGINPITGESAKDYGDRLLGGAGSTDTSVKKMIAIVIPTKNEKSWADRHDGKNYDEMHFIVADNMYKAKEKFYSYLKSTGEDKVENVIIDTHGGGPGLMYMDNVDGTFEIGINYFGVNNLKNLNEQNYNGRSNILSLKMILEKVKDNGNAIFLGCTLAKGNIGRDFLIEVHKYNYGTNTYASEAFNNGTLMEGKEYEGSLYNLYDKFMECIVWGKSTPLSTGGTHTNKKGEGFKLMTAFKGKYQDLAVVGNYDGNLFINGSIGAIKY